MADPPTGASQTGPDSEETAGSAQSPTRSTSSRRRTRGRGRGSDNGGDYGDGNGEGDHQEAIAGAVRRVAREIRTTRERGLTIDLERARRKGTPEILTWNVIKRSTDALSFNNYKAFMDYVLCNDDEALQRLDEIEQSKITDEKAARNIELRGRRFLPYTDTEAYRLLKVATEAFLMVNCGIELDDFISNDTYEQQLDAFDAEDVSGQTAEQWWQQYRFSVNGATNHILPYLLLIRNKLPDVPIKRRIFAEEPFNPREAERCYGILAEKLLHPCMVELIWSYWHEEGMMVQTVNAISRRFQNVRGPADRDPLAMVEIDPLRPLNSLLWGYIQDEQHRLSVVRRAYEYNHHYGLSLEGKAVPALRPADSRSQFLGAFHQLLHLASVFYKQDDDTTVVADGFPLLNALRDLHMVLTEGQHNQYGDLPTTARIEMLMEQWLLARPEFRELLPRRIMVGYPEPWMDSVDAMKRLQGWTDTSVTHFRFLGIFGEQLLLSVRFTRWSEIEDAELAAIWARFFRNQVQGYIHAYRAVTGVDLSAPSTTSQQRELITTAPSVLLRQRLQNGQRVPALPPGIPEAKPPPLENGAPPVKHPPAGRETVPTGRKAMLDFTSALYLGLQHSMGSLRPWSQLTTGAPAALIRPPGSDTVADQLARLQGCERGTLATSTLHLFWDLFGILAGCRVAIYLDAGAYPIAWWGVERAAGRGVPVYRFPHQDVLTLQQLLLQHPPYLMPVVVADGLCAACGCLSRLCPPRRGLAGAGRHPGPGASWCPDVLVISSLAKGFGAPLAALSGSRDAVQQFEARSQTRTHCSPPSVAAIHAADHALKINADHGDALRAQLARRIQRFRRRLAEIGLTAQGGLFPVQTLKLPLSLDVKGLHRQLLNFGVKTVLRHGHNGNAQVSFIITARHRPGEIDQAVRALAAATRVQSPGQSTGG